MKTLGSTSHLSEHPRSVSRGNNDLLTMLGQDRATKDISPILAEEFRRGFDLINEGHNSETWLRVAVWWLIKVILHSGAAGCC